MGGIACDVDFEEESKWIETLWWTRDSRFNPNECAKKTRDSQDCLEIEGLDKVLCVFMYVCYHGIC